MACSLASFASIVKGSTDVVSSRDIRQQLKHPVSQVQVNRARHHQLTKKATESHYHLHDSTASLPQSSRVQHRSSHLFRLIDQLCLRFTKPIKLAAVQLYLILLATDKLWHQFYHRLIRQDFLCRQFQVYVSKMLLQDRQLTDSPMDTIMDLTTMHQDADLNP